MTTLAHESGLQLAKRLNTGDLSALELLDYFLGRVGRFNPELNAIIELQEEEARARAIAADKALARERGRPLGPFHGVPMTIKESFDVAGMHTTRGNPAFKDHIATTDALAVSRLRKAGANIFGKTNVPFGSGRLSILQRHLRHHE